MAFTNQLILADNNLSVMHFFLDESGDTTFFGKHKSDIIGQSGVSVSFSLGIANFKEPLQPIRNCIISLQKQVIEDPYYKDIPSIKKKCQTKNGYFFHATDDLPEVRKLFFEYIKTLNFSFEMVVGRKIPSLYAKKHNSNPDEFYADLLSHLLKKHLRKPNKLVLNIAQRGKTTRNKILEIALNKAIARFRKTRNNSEIQANIVFNVQNQHSEPILNIVDYLCWSVQRVFEKGETRFYNYISDKISLVHDIYDSNNYNGSKNYYRRNNKLSSENKISPSLH